MNDTILEVKDLSVTFTQYERGFSRRTIHAVEKMDLEIKSGEIVAVVGSSGSGKSLLAHAIMGILPYNSEMDGEIRKKRSKDSGDMRSFWCPRAFLTWIRL